MEENPDIKLLENLVLIYPEIEYMPYVRQIHCSNMLFGLD